MKIEKKILNKLKKDLKGLQNTIASELGISQAQVSRTLNGINDSPAIISYCIKVRDREVKKKDQLQSKI